MPCNMLCLAAVCFVAYGLSLPRAGNEVILFRFVVLCSGHCSRDPRHAHLYQEVHAMPTTLAIRVKPHGSHINKGDRDD